MPGRRVAVFIDYQNCLGQARLAFRGPTNPATAGQVLSRALAQPRAVLKAPDPIRFDRSPPAPGVLVLSLGEAAVRLGVTRAQLEAMIAAGKIEALPTGYTRMISTREVERLADRGGTR